MIAKVKIDRFRCFTSTQELEFPTQGFYLVQGINRVERALEGNGAGKSSLWDAIVWCLYGKTSRGLKAGNVVPWGSKERPGAAVTVTLESKHCISRTQGPNTLRVDGEVVEQLQVDEIVGLSYTEFLNSMLLGQFNTMFLDRSPAEKLALLTDVLGLDYWVGCSDRAKKTVVELDGEKQLQELASAKLGGSIESSEGQLQRVSNEYEIFEIDRNREIDKKKKYLTLLNQQGLELKGELKEQSLPVKQGAVENKIQDLAEERDDLEGETEVQQRYSIKAQKDINALRSLDNAVCPTCRQKVSEEHVIRCIKPIQAELNRIHKRLTEINDRVVRIDEELVAAKANLKQELEALQVIEEQLNKVTDELAHVTREKKDTEARVFELGESENPYAQMIKRLERLLERDKKEKEKVEQELVTLKIEHELVSYWVGGFKQLRLWVIDSTLRELEIAVNTSLIELGLEGWEIRFEVERENTSGGITRGFAVFIKSPLVEDEVPWESWSGGESQRLRLAGQIGVSTLILARKGLQHSFEVWDEPTAHLSERGIQDLVGLLQERSRVQGRAVWLVDHRTLEYGEFDAVLDVIKEKGGSEIQWR